MLDSLVQGGDACRCHGPEVGNGKSSLGSSQHMCSQFVWLRACMSSRLWSESTASTTLCPARSAPHE
eukprot:1050707-Prymnesium_polylepis.2